MTPISCLCIGESTTLPGGEVVTREGLLTYRIGGLRHTLEEAVAAGVAFSDPVLTDASGWGTRTEGAEDGDEDPYCFSAGRVHVRPVGEVDGSMQRGVDEVPRLGGGLAETQPRSREEEKEDVGRAESYTARDQKLGCDAGIVAVTSASPSPSPGLRVLPGEGAAAGVRVVEQLRAGTDAEQRIGELRRAHGRALRVTGRSCAARARARWVAQQTWIRVSYPAV